MLFFKQKTAYDLRISDWSSDVCSSDLRPFRRAAVVPARIPPRRGRRFGIAVRPTFGHRMLGFDPAAQPGEIGQRLLVLRTTREADHLDLDRREPVGLHRSEEHTSELQSLMRLSNAVFCLKKKKT